MKRSTLWFLVSLTAVFLLCPQSGNAQGNSSSQTPERVMSELLEEVRMLRQEVRRLSAGTVRAQAVLERLRIQQGQVNRLTGDLNRLRTELTVMRSKRTEIKGNLGILQQKYDDGRIERVELESAKAVIAEIDQREPDLVTKEIELNNELIVERGVLDELNRKLDTIEREMQAPIERPKP
jgi:hypothetical protein